MKVSSGQALLGLGVVAAIVAVIAGLMVAGTPAEGRMQRQRILSNAFVVVILLRL